MSSIFQLTSWLSAAGGGIPPVIRALTAEYRQRQLDCVVAGLADTSGVSPAFPADWPVLAGRITGPVAYGYSPELARQLRGRVKKDSVIHVHGLWMYPGRLARKLSEGTGAVRIVSPHGMLEPWALQNSRWKKRLASWLFEKHNLRTADCLHALCEAEAKAMRAYGLKNPICIIPNGIDLPDLGKAQSAERKKVSGKWSVVSGPQSGVCPPTSDLQPQVSGLSISAFESGRKTLLYLGRIHPKKGLVNLLRAWRKAQSAKGKAEDWVLAIAGWDQGGHLAELKQLATELGINWAERKAQSAECGVNHASPSALGASRPISLLFTGPLFGPDKESAYRNCDAFILPSFSEGLPMVVLEAWAYGKPVLMTPECNLPEGFAAGAALRIEPSAEGIAHGLRELFETPCTSLSALGLRGRTLVASRFAWPKVATDMHSIYEWVLEGDKNRDVLFNSAKRQAVSAGRKGQRAKGKAQRA